MFSLFATINLQVFANDEDASAVTFAEPDSFWCLFHLLSNLRDLYECTLDFDRKNGVDCILRAFMSKLEYYDPELRRILDSKGVEPTYYAFRWFTCLLTQEFDLPDVIRIWDSLLADQSEPADNAQNSNLSSQLEYLMEFCCAMLIKLREEIKDSTFSDCIKLLQHYPNTDMKELLTLTSRLRMLGRDAVEQEIQAQKQAKSNNSRMRMPLFHIPATIRSLNASKILGKPVVSKENLTESLDKTRARLEGALRLSTDVFGRLKQRIQSSVIEEKRIMSAQLEVSQARLKQLHLHDESGIADMSDVVKSTVFSIDEFSDEEIPAKELPL